MSQRQKLIIRILCGAKDNDIPFEEVCGLLRGLGFSLRINGSHHVFYQDKIEEIIDIQPKNGKAKPYQVKQIRQIIIKYKLGGVLDV